MMKKVIKIEDMSCSHCISHVKKALEDITGVTVIEVSLDNKNAIVETNVTNDILKSAIENEGYELNSIE